MINFKNVHSKNKNDFICTHPKYLEIKLEYLLKIYILIKKKILKYL